MARHKKEYTVEAIGKYFVKYREYSDDMGKVQATKAIMDMLRYDHGTVVYMDIVKENRSFTAIIKCPRYTEGRWKSFGIRTREVNWDSYTNEEAGAIGLAQGTYFVKGVGFNL